MKTVLISTVWPEPTSSAAGVRTLQLLLFCQRAGFDTLVISPSQSNSFRTALDEQGFKTLQIPANDSSFDRAILEFKPELVIFDRFLMEEQFGARVQENAPEALRVIDTQDLHFLRKSREQSQHLQEKQRWLEPETQRELASIYRSDHTWLLSSYELGLLKTEFKVDPSLISTLGFSYREQYLPWSVETQHCAWIGNFRHAPNYDSVMWLARSIWPLVRAKLPKAELHIYGAYPPADVMKLNAPTQGLVVHGPAQDVTDTLKQYRLSLAPLRFGAGIKGKIAESWKAGVPVVTTALGAEGMCMSDGSFGGWLAASSDDQSFAEAVVSAYQSDAGRESAVKTGQEILREQFSFEKNYSKFVHTVNDLKLNRERLRSERWIQKILWQQQMRSTEYFSRWIELKNSKN